MPPHFKISRINTELYNTRGFDDGGIGTNMYMEKMLLVVIVSVYTSIFKIMRTLADLLLSFETEVTKVFYKMDQIVLWHLKN